MKLKGLLYVLLMLFAAASLKAQQYNYRHYTTRNGLPSMVVYKIIQDRKGFLWLGTAEGVSRFDGYTFRTFTIADGLPDNEILSVEEAPDGKIWLVPFQKDLAYIEHDSAYVFELPEVNKRIYGLNIDSKGHLWVAGGQGELWAFDGKKSIRHYQVNEFSNVLNAVLRGHADGLGNIWIGAEDSLFRITSSGKQLFIPPKANSIKSHAVPYTSATNQTYLLLRNRILRPSAGNRLEIILEADELSTDAHLFSLSFTRAGGWLVATSKGAFKITWKHGKKIIEPFLQGKNVSHCMEDAEGNLWFATLNDGLYMLSNASVQVLNLDERRGLADKPVSIFKVQDRIYVSYAFANLQQLVMTDTGYIAQTFPAEYLTSHMGECYNVAGSGHWCRAVPGLLYFADALPGDKNNLSWYGRSTSETLDGLYSRKYDVINIGNSKAAVLVNDSVIWVAASTGLFSVDFHSNSDAYVVKRPFKERTSAVAYQAQQNRVWFSSSNRLYYIEGDSAKLSTSVRPQTAITALHVTATNQLLVGTSGEGIFILDGTQLTQYTTTAGLPSNNITYISALPSGYLVSTSRGLWRLSNQLEGFSVQINDGLLGEETGKTVVSGNNLFVLTNRGVSVAPLAAIQPDTAAPITHITRVTIADKDTLTTSSYTLPYNQNSIRLEYVGISYKSQGRVLYRYQMEGIDTGWVQTTFTNVQYPTLQPGTYIFKVDSRSLQGEWGNKPATLQITILPPYWQTWWFRLLIAILAIGLLAGISYAVIRYYRNQSRIAQRMVQLEGQALRAQMNPHFIFNALNAIHDFIANQDERSAHLYLGKFALLIRKILNQSRKQEISLEEEINTLKLYIELEALRFPQQFHYHIDCEEHLLVSDVHIPPMLVQPYVENAIRHGLMNSERIGKLHISFQREGSQLKIEVEDNGIGRLKALEISSKRLATHRSVGMDITKQRISLQGNTSENTENIEIVDIFNDNQQPAGTRVTFYVAINEWEK